MGLVDALSSAVKCVTSTDRLCEMAEDLTEQALTPLVGEDLAELAGDAAGFGVAYATGNEYQMAMQACDVIGVEDELPDWVKAGASMALAHGSVPGAGNAVDQRSGPSMGKALGSSLAPTLEAEVERAAAPLVGAEMAEQLGDFAAMGAHAALGDDQALVSDAVDAAGLDEQMPPWVRQQLEAFLRGQLGPDPTAKEYDRLQAENDVLGLA